MNKKNFQKSPLWGWSYDYPQLDEKLTKIHKNLIELENMLTEKKEQKGFRKKK